MLGPEAFYAENSIETHYRNIVTRKALNKLGFDSACCMNLITAFKGLTLHYFSFKTINLSRSTVIRNHKKSVRNTSTYVASKFIKMSNSCQVTSRSHKQKKGENKNFQMSGNSICHYKSELLQINC